MQTRPRRPRYISHNWPLTPQKYHVAETYIGTESEKKEQELNKATRCGELDPENTTYFFLSKMSSYKVVDRYAISKEYVLPHLVY